MASHSQPNQANHCVQPAGGGPATYKSLHDNVIRKLDGNFGLKVSETSYIYQFDWLVDAKAIQKADEFYRLADLPADIIDLVNKRIRMKMKA